MTEARHPLQTLPSSKNPLFNIFNPSLAATLVEDLLRKRPTPSGERHFSYRSSLNTLHRVPSSSIFYFDFSKKKVFPLLRKVSHFLPSPVCFASTRSLSHRFCSIYYMKKTHSYTFQERKKK